MFRLSDKGEKIQQMFGAIAPRYDFLNRLLSFGIDRRWRTRAVQMLRYQAGSRILDVATGTGDVALEIARLTPASVNSLNGIAPLIVPTTRFTGFGVTAATIARTASMSGGYGA